MLENDSIIIGQLSLLGNGWRCSVGVSDLVGIWMFWDLSQLKIVMALTLAFALAGILGFVTQRLKISPILGYLLAGYIVGPFSPGLVLDTEIAEQLAEIGVVLMMFGIGLHFKWRDLVRVKNIAIAGGVGQTVIATLVGMLLVHQIGFPLSIGLVIGLAVSVASTVVLVRGLTANKLMTTPQGHVAVGWLVVEDIVTVIVLLLLPVYALSLSGVALSLPSIGLTLLILLGKFALLALLTFSVGQKVVTFLLVRVSNTRSRELLTLAVLALTFVIATGSAYIFGTSIALGAFLAGMVIGQADVKHKAAANALPIRDVFVVFFFLSVGMLFHPQAIISNFSLFLCLLLVVLVAKPFTAFFITRLLRYPLRTAAVVAVALAQIGEFSFILAQESRRLEILPIEAYDMIVACALITIAINPLLFRILRKKHK